MQLMCRYVECKLPNHKEQGPNKTTLSTKKKPGLHLIQSTATTAVAMPISLAVFGALILTPLIAFIHYSSTNELKTFSTVKPIQILIYLTVHSIPLFSTSLLPPSHPPLFSSPPSFFALPQLEVKWWCHNLSIGFRTFPPDIPLFYNFLSCQM